MTEHDRPTPQPNGVAPHDAPETLRTEPALPALTSGMVTGRSELGRFGPGNPGRPRGALGKRRRIALEWFDQYNFDPLESKILLCQSLQQRLVADTFASEYERIEYHKLYSETLKDVLQYGYQRLKAVEHFGQLELVQKLQELESYTDDELRTLLAEAKEYARRHPSGGASCP